MNLFTSEEFYGFGIYGIKNKLLGTIYIGQTRIFFRERWKQHIKNLEQKRHHNGLLQRDWNIHRGLDGFEFIVIEELKDVKKLIEREKYWLNHYSTKTFCYNGYGGYELERARKRQPSFVWKHKESHE